MYRKEIMADMIMEAAEYIIMFCSPNPKEALKAMEARRAAVRKARIKAGYIDANPDDEENKLFVKDHRNTTFFDEISKQAGRDVSAEIAQAFGEDADGLNTNSTELYTPDMEDIDFINKAIAAKKEIEQKYRDRQKLDTVEF